MCGNRHGRGGAGQPATAHRCPGRARSGYAATSMNTTTSEGRGDNDRTALVLAGGAARGAYKVGVVQHVVEEVSRDLGREVRLDVISGTSVGALNACGLAAFA